MENKPVAKSEIQQNGKRVNTKERNSKGPRYYNNGWNNSGLNDRYYQDNRNGGGGGGGRRRHYRSRSHNNGGSNPGSNYRHNNQNEHGSEKRGRGDIIEDSNKSNHENQSGKSFTKKPPYSHYHHRNSNKPRFAKTLEEKRREEKQSVPSKPPIGIKDSEQPDQECSRHQDRPKSEKIAGRVERSSGKVTTDTAEHGTSPLCNGDNTDLINELHDIGKNLKANSTESADVFEKLKSGETDGALDNLKQLYDKIPDITQSNIVKEAEEWNGDISQENGVKDEAGGSDKGSDVTTSDDVKSSVMTCCPHSTCCPPFYPHPYIPTIPHPSYYYALWNFHHPMPPPPVQRLTSAPALPTTPDENVSVHKRYITRSTRTPGTITFTIFHTDSLKIISVRCDKDYTMTADICNEEGVKVTENFALHNADSLKLYERYYFTGNHTLIFNIDAPKTTTVVITFLHEITIK